MTPTAATAANDTALTIYDNTYSRSYPSLYQEPWPEKHRLNLETLETILSGLCTRTPRWLDLACGQAWHFSMLPGRAEMTGVDISEAQLAQARKRVEGATFVCADMTQSVFRPASFDLVTCFWGAYCYLSSPDRITSFVRATLDLLAPGGALYFELLLAEDLAAFNDSRFAKQTGFFVTPRSADFSQWQYDDVGGRHLMTSPPLEAFLEIVGPQFRSIEARHDGAFMVHLVGQDLI